MIKAALICSMLALMPVSALAQEQESDMSKGTELLGEGAMMLLRGLMDELEPAAEGWSSLMEMINDFSAYEMPEMLPNGDIIIRRKEPLAPGTGQESEIDL